MNGTRQHLEPSPAPPQDKTHYHGGSSYWKWWIAVAAVATWLFTKVRSASLSLAVVATGLLVAVEVPFFWSRLSESYVPKLPLDLLWLASYVLLGAAVLHPSVVDLPQERARSRARLSSALALVAGAILLPTLTLAMSDSVDVITTAVVATMISILVIVRLSTAAREKEDALQQAVDALDALALKERSFRLLAENSQDVIFRYRLFPEAGFDYVSPASTYVMGLSAEECYSDPLVWQQVAHPPFAPDLTYAEIPDGPFILPWKHKSGRVVWIDLLLTPIVEGERLVAVEGRGRDVTEHVAASQRLETLRAQSDAILNSAGQGIIYTDSSNLITFANLAAADMLGWDLEDLLGRDGHECVHHSRKDGTPYPKSECPIGRSFESGVKLETDHEWFWRKDGTCFPIDLVVTPLVGGNASGAVVVFSDKSDREELQQRIRQAEKMEAFGQLAGGVAHDFNNLLSVVINCGAFLLEDLEDDDPRAEDVREIVVAGERGARLTRQLLTFSRRDHSRPENISANEIIRHTTNMLRRTIKESVAVELDLDEDLWQMYLDAGQFEQVILNLAVNASDAMPDGGELRIRTENLESDRDSTVPCDQVAIDVSDSGTGIPEAVQDRIFEPFFTTKGVDQGTGLGLATVYGIVQGAEGSISCESELGTGTTFKVLFPRSSHGEDLEVGRKQQPATGAGRIILVVEDQAAVLEVIIRLLRNNGYAPIPFGHPRRAIEFWNSSEKEASLLLTDIVMPGMSGVELAEKIDLPVVYMTGYPDRSLNDLSYPQEDIVLRKPFREDELMQAVESTLGVLRSAAVP